jgi:FMN-dependent NADH-azoreductase
MNSLLLIECSPRQEHSVSRLAAARLVERLLDREPSKYRVIEGTMTPEGPVRQKDSTSGRTAARIRTE